jgi:CRP/FNR family transcriptional regulator, cyclic AMP receptor protein
MPTLTAPRDRVRPFMSNNTFLGRLPAVVLDGMLARGQMKRLAKGERAYRRGDAGNSFMVLVDGRIKLTNISLEGREVVLHYVGAGDIFGEISALDGKERAADAIAMEDSEIFVVCTRDLMPTLSAHPEAMLAILHALCDKIRLGAAIIEDNTLEMRGRTARGLLRLAHLQGRINADGFYQLTITQEEIGKYLGMARANVNRQLGQLKIANVIRLSGTDITIIDEQGLYDIGQETPAKP